MEIMFRTLAVMTLVVFLSLLSTGCAKKQIKSGAEVPAPAETMKEEPVETGKGMGDTGMATEVESLESKPRPEEGAVVLEGRTHAPMLPIYFDFDRSNIREDQKARIQENADYLLANRLKKIRIEGNCDERGTNEYNMALGERRALSAKKYLVNLGIKDSRLETISYGEERPLQYGHDELSWAQNRRDDFVIIQ